ncbi:hypothetical protein MMYC01_202393 [Madurella mycetomatis]|uniref:N-acetyltransferase domain-containing protein n=1 Tax=Madurella mycetomatis TaxID=100816 RepID=A0A175VVW0_9PEZI|nr:hypothetical protein MMYC01_209040 [Madurella mycetomatis]KXX79961.1 hypothetical protein MMYC01_202393 [Madurella mycetomatis]
MLPETLPISAADHDEVLRAVYDSDQAMYPVALPYERLQSWVTVCPELSVRFRNTAVDTAWKACGLIIVLPLRRVYWEKLLDGRLKEADIQAESMFPGWYLRGGDGSGSGLEEVEVGLHVYHIERDFTAEWESPRAAPADPGCRKKGFAEFALEEVVRRAKGWPGWRIVGMSALTATPAGKRTFEKLGFTPTGYRELFITENAPGTNAVEGKAQVEMICLYPDDGGEAATIADGRKVISKSEMTVKFIQV